MKIHIQDTPAKLGEAAGALAASAIRTVLQMRNEVNIILATGSSQFATLQHLIRSSLDWGRIRMFHLDEYIGLPESHPASFRKYLRERFILQVPALMDYFLIDGEAPDPAAECDRLEKLIRRYPIDVALIGIGENGHLAFNDPPADFTTHSAYHIVHLDQACRQQQVGEGWFPDWEAVPATAISMTIPQILASDKLIVSVPDSRKAHAVKCTVHGLVDPGCPASILQNHPNCDLFLDLNAAVLL
ncbi:MAG: glucosamine-6-phosphate deaminase [Lewinellaceae bacterium]|nr:glucosamine-6-phosphate deaminase [Lewinellaceae bacterium]HPQ98372.1 glucosamine-6-phosphate deaminase [Saprospiraceae bacterium]